jgi:agmatine deiminase
MKVLNSYPSDDGFYMPAEYDRHLGCFMIWPQRPGSWGKDASNARKAFCEVASVIARSEDVYMAVSKEEYDRARIMLKDSGRIHLIKAESDDAWARDSGATFVVDNKHNLRGIDWQFNAWGGAYDGLYASWDKDQKLASLISETVDADIYDAGHFVLEGGSIHVDGEGTLITTEECLLSPGRNPRMSKLDIENELKRYLGVEKIIWLPFGIYNDETNGHVDNFCCFVSPSEVVLAWTDDKDDPQYENSRLAFDILSKETDAKGRRIKIHKLPIPSRPVCIDEADLLNFVFEEGEDEREAGERLAASYVNFYISNDNVLVPQFGDINDRKALDILAECFPDREVIGIYAMDILKGGGNIHCITQQIPWRNDERC